MTRYTAAEREEAALICAIVASTSPWLTTGDARHCTGAAARVQMLAHSAWAQAFEHPVSRQPANHRCGKRWGDWTRAVYAEAEALIRNGEI